MKKILLVLTVLIGYGTTAQTTAGGGDLGASGMAVHDQLSNVVNPSNGFIIRNPVKRRVEGTNYLYDNWNNFCEIITMENDRYGVRNVNLNIKRNTVEAKFSGDSIFVFNFNNIKKFVINGQTFKNYYWDDDNRLYQIIFESKDFALIKGYKITEVEASANPMLNRSYDRLIRKQYYYIKTEDGIKPFTLKKRKILNLISKKNKAVEKVKEYAEKYRLSFGNEEDIKKILEYSLGESS